MRLTDAARQVNRSSADPSITEAAEKENAMAQQLDNLEAQVLLSRALKSCRAPIPNLLM